MAVARVNMHVLDVGQGACNYVEIVDDTGKVIHNMLIDLGTNSEQTIAEDNVEWLKEKIKDRDNPRIDYLIITHGDTDHYNMMLKILPALAPEDTGRIGVVRYGGVSTRYQIGKTSLISELKKYCIDVDTFVKSGTSYDKDNDKWLPIWPADPKPGDVQLYIIIANTPHPNDKRAKDAEAVNTKSIVSGLYWNNYWIIASGDATATTIGAVNELLENATNLPGTFMLTLPHHGSRKTTYDLKKAADIPSDDAVEVIDKFLGIFKPQSMSVSAGVKRHHHPSMLMVKQFAKYTKQDKVFWYDTELSILRQRHFLTCWVDEEITAIDVDPAWPPKWLYGTTQTSQNVYSTLYFRPWVYNQAFTREEKIKGSKKRKIETYYVHYVYPPAPAVILEDDREQEDVPDGRNWQFYMTGAGLFLDSTKNEARARAARADFAAAAKEPPASATAAAGRAARAAVATATAPALPAVAIAWPTQRLLLEPGAPRLRSLKAIT